MAQVVAQNYFSTLGVNAVHGRTFQPDDLEGPPVVVLGYDFWKRHFGASTDVVGNTLTLSGRTYTIIGVAPPGHSLPSIAQPDRAEDLWILLRPDEPMPFDKSYREAPQQPIGLVGRLAPGRTAQQLKAELSAIKSRADEHQPNVYRNYTPFVANLQQDATRSLRPTLLVLTGAVGIVLLIVCANVAGFLLARAAERRKELAIRTALGAGRWRLVRQSLTESAVLALLGAAGGVLLAKEAIHFFLALNPFEIPAFNDIGINYRVLTFTVVLSLLTAALFGVIPALQATRLDVNAMLKENARGGSTGIRPLRARRLLIVAEVALSLLLLAVAGLMTRSFARLKGEPLGFRTGEIVAIGINLPQKSYPEMHQRMSYFDRLLERIRNLPGVQAASATTVLPVYAGGSDEFAAEGSPSTSPDEMLTAGSVLITPDYFSSVGIPLLEGRPFDGADVESGEPVAIVNQTLARQFFADSDPLGRRIKSGKVSDKSPSRRIVGVVGDNKTNVYGNLGWRAKALMYVPYRQVADINAMAHGMSIVIRPVGDPRSLAGMIRDEFKALDRDLPPPEIQNMEELVARPLRQPRLQTLSAGIFATIALLLAALGLYGVISYSVIQRTHEIGIRMALGAQAGDVLRLVIRQGLALIMAGVVIGLAGTFALTRILKSLLYGVSEHDPLTFVSIALLLTGVALVACYLPARRATKVDPIVSLRCE
jgi:putative ABC transport system permease protein